jgi:hypothetical protein
MPDYGHELEFGYFLTPEAADPAGVLATTRLLDGRRCCASCKWCTT